MSSPIIIYVLSFLVGTLWFRLLFYIFPKHFKRPFIRSATRLRWYHLHFGIIMILSGVVYSILFERNTFLLIWLGLGSGFIIDLFIPSLELPTNRQKELILYSKTFLPTLFLSLEICLVVITLSLISK